MSSSVARRACLIVRTSLVARSPDIINCAKALHMHGWQVTVLAPFDAPLPEYHFPEPGIESAKFSQQEVPSSGFGRIASIFYFIKWVVSQMGLRSVDLVIGFDPDGLIAAGVVARVKKVPFVYYSLELYTQSEIRRLDQRLKKWWERFLNRRALATITHDRRREKVLRQINKLPEDHRVFLIPNAPMSQRKKAADGVSKVGELLQRAGISDGKRIILYHGGIGDQSLHGELVDSVENWPQDWVLVIHGWGDEGYIDRLRKIAAQHDPPRIVWSTEFLPYEQLDELSSSSDVGIALYQDIGSRNIFEMASGKIYQYLKGGLPVVTVNFPNLVEAVQECGCGLAVDVSDMGNVVAALHAILDDPETYRTFSVQARKVFEQKYSYDKNFVAFTVFLEQIFDARSE